MSGQTLPPVWRYSGHCVQGLALAIAILTLASACGDQSESASSGAPSEQTVPLKSTPAPPAPPSGPPKLKPSPQTSPPVAAHPKATASRKPLKRTSGSRDELELRRRIAIALVLAVDRGLDMFELTSGEIKIKRNGTAQHEIKLTPGASYSICIVRDSRRDISYSLYDGYGNLVDSESSSGSGLAMSLRSLRITEAPVDIRVTIDCGGAQCGYALLTLCRSDFGTCGVGLTDLYETYGSWEAVTDAYDTYRRRK